MLEDITIIIKTFERYESLGYLLSSIVKMNLPCPVLVADDSEVKRKDDVRGRDDRHIMMQINNLREIRRVA